ncbi:hypothetical protein [Selenomonas ruminantium]|uniref:Uncharacterized protein n=1 Tax=Selenomonas ruminantium TaxID=971 RepID=A0A1I0Y9C1_SELRU|nr:hypothetical protein [Selenomonas ruminantium]SFB09949.1 hypothetical protein SAMN05216587_11114 [Selenomonas ruminantium]
MVEKSKINASLSEITLSAEPNKMIIVGCVATIGKASTGSPCGADGKRVAFTQDSIVACAKSFEGMPLNCTYPDGWFADGTELFTNHGSTNIGYIRKCYAQGDNLMAEIVVWKDKFPDESYMIINGMSALGFSLEWYAKATHEEDKVVFMDEFEGCGCAILWQNCAAFSDTFIEKLAAAKAKERECDVEMTKEEKETLVKEIAAGVVESMEERLKKIEETQAELKSAAEKGADEAFKEIKDSIAEIKAAAEKAQGEVDEIKAAAEAKENEANEPAEPVKAAEEVPPAPKAAQSAVPNPNLDNGNEREEKLAEIKASAMNPMEKIKEITKLRMQG